MKLVQKTLVGMGAAIVCTSIPLFQLTTTAQSTPVQLAQTRGNTTIFGQRTVSGPAPGGRSRGGGVRGDNPVCPVTELPLTALVPFEERYPPDSENQPPIVNVWGFTHAERPTFWIYVPYTNPAIAATFTLQTDNDDALTVIHEATVPLPKQPGIIGVRLPQSAPALKPGVRYRWFFSLDCKPSTASTADANTVYVEAVILRDRLPASAASRLSPTPSLQNVAIYVENGFWHDALTTLAELRQQRPQTADLNAAWRDLLANISSTEKAKQNFQVEKIAEQQFVK